MIRFPESDREYVQKKDCTTIIMPNGSERIICPYCKDHKQLTSKEMIEQKIDYCDCKTVIYEDVLLDGKLQGGNTQCCCYSKEHIFKEVEKNVRKL